MLLPVEYNCEPLKGREYIPVLILSAELLKSILAGINISTFRNTSDLFYKRFPTQEKAKSGEHPNLLLFYAQNGETVKEKAPGPHSYTICRAQ